MDSKTLMKHTILIMLCVAQCAMAQEKPKLPTIPKINPKANKILRKLRETLQPNYIRLGTCAPVTASTQRAHAKVVNSMEKWIKEL
jgi:hypothetical protein